MKKLVLVMVAVFMLLGITMAGNANASVHSKANNIASMKNACGKKKSSMKKMHNACGKKKSSMKTKYKMYNPCA